VDVKRGFAAIGLYASQKEPNVAGAFRAAACYGAALVVIQGKMVKLAADTPKAHRTIPHLVVDDILKGIPFDTIPVVVELTPNSRPLPSFVHPERAFYIFGPEGGSVPQRVIDKCPLVVSIPMNIPMNLAATVNVVLYDRLAKCLV